MSKTVPTYNKNIKMPKYLLSYKFQLYLNVYNLMHFFEVHPPQNFTDEMMFS